MAYNNMFPMNYQSYYSPMYQSQNPAQSQNGIIWVQGEAGAKSYLVAPNTTVQLWDSEDQVIYLKSADASGMPSIKILDYKIRNQSTPNVQRNNENIMYVTKDELENELNKLRDKIAHINDRRVNHESTLSIDAEQQ